MEGNKVYLFTGLNLRMSLASKRSSYMLITLDKFISLSECFLKIENKTLLLL